MKKGEFYYGGRYWGLGNKWLWFWLADYRENTIVKNCKFSLQIGSCFFGNKEIIKV